MNRPRDGQKGKFWRAWNKAEEELRMRDENPLVEFFGWGPSDRKNENKLQLIREFRDKVIAQKYWRKLDPSIGDGLNIFHTTKRCGTWNTTTREIWVPDWACSDFGVLRFFAWFVAPTSDEEGEPLPYHSRQFVTIYLGLVKRFMGKSAFDVFRKHLRAHKVKYRKKTERPDLVGKEPPWIVNRREKFDLPTFEPEEI